MASRSARYPLYKSREWQAVRKIVLYRDGFRCFYCGSLANTVDHLIPRSRGGSIALENLVACCKSCNCRKSKKWHDEVSPSIEWMEAMPNPNLQFGMEPAPAGRIGRELTEEGQEAQYVRDQLQANTGKWAMIRSFSGSDAKDEARGYAQRLQRPGWSTAVRETNAGVWSVYGRHTGVVRPRKKKTVEAQAEGNGEVVESSFGG